MDQIVITTYLPRIRNKELKSISTPYSIFDRIDSIPYLVRIRKKEWNSVFVPYSLFSKIDITLERHLRKLHVFT